jgi:hypothetical protein
MLSRPWSYRVASPGRSLMHASFRLPITRSTARAVRDGLVLAGVIFAIFNWWLLTTGGGQPVDVHYYWAANHSDLYPLLDRGLRNGYVYSPAFEFIAAPLRALTFATYVAVWRGALFVTLAWLAGPFLLPVLFWVPVQSEINAGNIQILLALAVVLGFRWPATWSFVLLTKLTPGVGLLWFAIRREWHALAVALGATVLIAALSFALQPSAWPEWIRFLTSNAEPSVAPYYVSFWIRLPFALVAVVLAALTDRKWLLVAGVTLALPVYYVISSSLLVGVLPYVRQACGRALARWFGARTAWLESCGQAAQVLTPAPESAN